MAQRYGSDVFFSTPSDLITDSLGRERNQKQAQTFFQGIHSGQMQGRHNSSTLLSFDTHQDEADDPGLQAKLPRPDELRKEGINKVFLAVEVFPVGAQTFTYQRPDGYKHQPVIDWLQELQLAGISVVSDGIDTRHYNFLNPKK